MAALFYAHKAIGVVPPCYFIESTAPNNIDDGPTPLLDLKKAQLEGVLEYVEADQAVSEIAKHLADAQAPNLVVMVHGFNNPELAALKLYKTAAQAAAADPAISTRKGLVCIGYRWPSEKMPQPWNTARQALPPFPVRILWGGALVVLVSLIAYVWFNSWLWHIPVILGLALMGLVAVAMLLRCIVYFRDGYRAVNYGVPDLIEIIRQIDASVLGLSSSPRRNWIELSFIGHSMGGFVVTNSIRALTDLFAPDGLRQSLNTGTIRSVEGPIEKVSSGIGHVFTLKRFVLASPDIPAETLLSNRANFLEPALRRFEEAYLFSNEGDEVLRLISTTANYFSFPTRSWTYGYRLGNVEILSSGYGLIDPRQEGFLRSLRIGVNTLHKLYKKLRDSEIPPGGAVVADKGKSSYQEKLPKVFTYFDCTDYVDASGDGKPA
ncbi:MAG: hypothetical protein ACHQAQ_14260, partial [Hyphomicrobiales bacterium]